MTYTASTAPIAWHCHKGRFTVRWRRGEEVAYVLTGRRMDDRGMTEVIDTIAVRTDGWTDAVEVRALADRWATKAGA